MEQSFQAFFIPHLSGEIDILNKQFYPRELTRSQFPAMQDLAVQPTNHKVKRKQISLPVTEQI